MAASRKVFYITNALLTHSPPLLYFNALPVVLSFSFIAAYFFISHRIAGVAFRPPVQNAKLQAKPVQKVINSILHQMLNSIK